MSEAPFSNNNHQRRLSRYLIFASRNKLMFFALSFVGLQVLLAILAPILDFQDPYYQVMVQRMKPPNELNWLGTDHLGRDVLARRTSLLTCTSAVLLALLVEGSLGVLSAWYGGWFDRIIMRIMDIFFAFPILVEASLSFLGLGAQPPVPSLGLALSEGRSFLLL